MNVYGDSDYHLNTRFNTPQFLKFTMKSRKEFYTILINFGF